jgi:hypothetical protein
MSSPTCSHCGVKLDKLNAQFHDIEHFPCCKECFRKVAYVISSPLPKVPLVGIATATECNHGVPLNTVCEQCQGVLPGERDPHGKDPHAPGAKLDAGKLKIGLVLADFANALEAVAKIGTDGAEKYTEHGWLTVPNGRARYTDAMLRHYFKESTEGEMDPSGSLHAAHLAWNALARLELQLRGQER